MIMAKQTRIELVREQVNAGTLALNLKLLRGEDWFKQLAPYVAKDGILEADRKAVAEYKDALVKGRGKITEAQESAYHALTILESQLQRKLNLVARSIEANLKAEFHIHSLNDAINEVDENGGSLASARLTRSTLADIHKKMKRYHGIASVDAIGGVITILVLVNV
jgi:hypothetical protein